MTNSSHNRNILALSFWPLVLAGFASRLGLMTLSLWEDEAWVANSALSPTLAGMFHYPNWLQTSPPLFLLFLRGATIFGRSEAILRSVPWLAGAASVVLMAILLKRMFPSALAVMGTLFFLTNYWAVKYSQQIKQYSTDLLVSTLFVFFLFRYLENGPTRRNYWALALTGGIGIFLSYAAIFWFPVALLAIVIVPVPAEPGAQESKKKDSLYARLVSVLPALVVYLAGLGFVDLFFIRPNRSPTLMDFWRNDFIGSGGLLSSLLRFLVTCCDLMAPQRFSWSRPISFALGLIVLAGLIRAAIGLRADTRARNLLLVTVFPVLVALVLSAFRQYPLLTYPRMIIWMLPLYTLLLMYAVEPVWNMLAAKIGMPVSDALAAGTALLLCVFAVYFNLFLVPRSNGQDARSAITYLRDHVAPQEPLFVRGITREQLIYYSESLHWQPPSVFVGDTYLPCCLRTTEVIPQSLADRGFAQDILSFAALAPGKRAWFLMDHGAYQKMLDTARSAMASAGCENARRTDFEGMSVFRFDCMSSSTAGSGGLP